MVNSADHSQILYQAYEQFLLPVFNKKVPMPYRINIPPDEHPAKQGKSAPEVILKQLQEDARNQNFDLQKASMEETREFMRKNQLGIDCSGFAYRILDFLVQKIKGKSLEDFGFPHVGITNVNILTSDEFSGAFKLPFRGFLDFSKVKSPSVLTNKTFGKGLQGKSAVLLVL